MKCEDVDTSKFDPERDDRKKIGDNFWVPCRICEKIFSQIATDSPVLQHVRACIL